MNAEILPLTPTTEQRAKMAYVYIRQSSLMQVTRHAESTELQYSLVERAVSLGGLVTAWNSLMRIWANQEHEPRHVVAFSGCSPRLVWLASVWCSALMPPAWHATIVIGINCWKSARSSAH